MQKLKLSAGLQDNYTSWEAALEKIMAVPSYKMFFKETSKFKPVVVRNDINFGPTNNEGESHQNCLRAELEGLGKRVSGWNLYCEHLFEIIPEGMCKLVHHSNIFLPDGTYVNPTDSGYSHHIFLRDDKRDYDFESDIGYNDRTWFTRKFNVKPFKIGRVPRNTVMFSKRSAIDSDPFFEKYKFCNTIEEFYDQIPKGLPEEYMDKWIKLKTSGGWY